MQLHFNQYYISTYNAETTISLEARERYLSSFRYMLLNVILKVLNHIVYVATNYQPIAHTILALNRCTALAFPLVHSKMWRGRNVARAMMVNVATAILLGLVPSVCYDLFIVSATVSYNWYAAGVSVRFCLVFLLRNVCGV